MHEARSMRVALVGLALGAMLTTGCSSSEHRRDSLQTLARWEDQRLADTDSLVALLADGDAHVRRAALRTAGLIGRSDVLREVMAGLDDSSESVRAAAAEALGFLGDETAVAPLTDALQDPRTRLRLAALFALARLPHDGSPLLETALHGPEHEAALAWDGLRDRSGDADPATLADAVRNGLIRPEAEIIWRVLRCAERLPDQDLVADIAPFARFDNAQVRVHACRALSRQGGAEALAAVLACGEAPGRFGRRGTDRVRIAVLNALGALGTDALSGDGDNADLVGQLAAGARHENPHVARSALESMTRIVSDMPLPAAAAARESLLPVWRIRLLHSARTQLLPEGDGPEPAPVVRAAAAEACIALRGAGIVTDPAWPRIDGDEDLLVRQAVWMGLCRHALTPAEAVRWAETVGGNQPAALRMAACSALTEAWRRFQGEDHPALMLARAGAVIQETLRRILLGTDPYAAANAADLISAFPGGDNLGALLQAYEDARGLPGVDLRRSALGAVTVYLADSTYALTDSLRPRAAAAIEAGFDTPEPWVRTAARAAAVAGDLIAPELIPSEASLHATLPAHARDPRQPPVAMAFDAPRVRCVTDRGEFVMKLDGERAPNTCAAFLALIREGFYENLTFHRVVPDFVIQGGDPLGTGWGGPGYTIRSEWSTAPYARGAIGIAHSGKDTGGSQFFVALSPQPHLNGRYTVFGKVVDGLDVAESIQPSETFRLIIEN